MAEMFVMYAVIKWSCIMGIANLRSTSHLLDVLLQLKRNTTLLAVRDCVTFKKIYIFISSKFLFLARDNRIFEVYVNHS